MCNTICPHDLLIGIDNSEKDIGEIYIQDEILNHFGGS